MAGTDTPPSFRVHEQDRSPGLGILRFLPNMADHQHDLPGLRCEDRIIGDCELIYFVGGICREFGVGRTVLFDLFRSRRGISPASIVPIGMYRVRPAMPAQAREG